MRNIHKDHIYLCNFFISLCMVVDGSSLQNYKWLYKEVDEHCVWMNDYLMKYWEYDEEY